MLKILIPFFIFCFISCRDEYVIEDLSSGQTFNVSGGGNLELRSNISELSNRNEWLVTLKYSKELKSVLEEDLELINAQFNSLTRKNSSEYELSISPINNGLVEVRISTSGRRKFFGNLEIVPPKFQATFDNISPQITFNHSIGPLTNSNSWNVGISVDEKIQNLAETDFTLSNCTISSLQKVNDNLYNITISPTNEGAVIVAIADGQLLDLAGNESDPIISINSTYDLTPPVVTIGNLPLAGIGIANESSYNLRGSCDSTQGDVAINVGSSQFNSSCVAGSWLVVDLSSVSDGNLDVVASQTDDAGNTGQATTTVNKESQSPTVVLTSSPPIATNQNTFTVTATFSEPVNFVTSSDLNLSSLMATSTLISGSDGDRVFTFEVNVINEASYTIDMSAGAARDSALNQSIASNQLIVAYDTTAPTVQLNALGQINSGNESNYTISGTCGEDDAGETVNLSIGSISTTATCIANGDGNPSVFSATLDASSLDDALMILVSAQISDAASNTNTDEAFVSKNMNSTTVTLSTTEPSPTASISWVVQASFAEEPVGLELHDFVVYNGTPSNLALIDSTTYEVTITPIANGAVRVGIVSESFTNANSDPNLPSNIVETVLSRGGIAMPPNFGNSNTNIDTSMSFQSQLYNEPAFDDFASGYIQKYHSGYLGFRFVATDAGVSISRSDTMITYFTQSSANYGLSSYVNDVLTAPNGNIVIATENGLAYSNDKSFTWLTFSSNNDAVKNLFKNSTGQYYALGENSFYKSPDFIPNFTWSSVTNSSLGFSNPTDVAIDSQGNIAIITSNIDEEIYVSTDNGVSFSHIDANICSGSRLSGISIDTNDELFVTCFGGILSGLYKLNGVLSNPAVLAAPTYKKLSTLPGSGHSNLYVDGFNIYVPKSGSIAISKNRGLTWQEHFYGATSGILYPDISKISKSGGLIYFYSATPKLGIFYTLDAGDNFVPRFEDKKYYYSLDKDLLSSANFIDHLGSNLYFLNGDNKIFKSTDNGDTINMINAALPENITGLLVDSNEDLFLRTTSSLFKFDTTLETFSELTTPFSSNEQTFLESNDTLWIRSDTNYASSNDSGATWTDHGANGLFGYNEGSDSCDAGFPNCRSLEKIYKNGSNILIANSYGFSSSTDNGVNWTKVDKTTHCAGNLSSLYIDDFDNFYVACDGLITSSDGVNFNYLSNLALGLSDDDKIKILVSGSNDISKVIHLIDKSKYCQKVSASVTFSCFDHSDGLSNQIKDFMIDVNGDVKIYTTSGIFVPIP